jgi:F0F1-type ATP synthase membrane subunit b/b'
MLELARDRAEQLMNESRDSIRNQVHAAKTQLGQEAQEIARAITATVLRRSA